jgi:hypothetical protein
MRPVVLSRPMDCANLGKPEKAKHGGNETMSLFVRLSKSALEHEQTIALALTHGAMQACIMRLASKRVSAWRSYPLG